MVYNTPMHASITAENFIKIAKSACFLTETAAEFTTIPPSLFAGTPRATVLHDFMYYQMIITCYMKQHHSSFRTR